ncbi:MAG: hypothetical protein ABSD13_16800 [Candidatus Korobacteraceae bacterium]|jgi:uncharacterized protein (DUF1501 family)
MVVATCSDDLRFLRSSPGLEIQQLYEQRDLAIIADFRQPSAEIVARQFGNPKLEHIFPGFNPYGSLHLLG